MDFTNQALLEFWVLEERKSQRRLVLRLHFLRISASTKNLLPLSSCFLFSFLYCSLPPHRRQRFLERSESPLFWKLREKKEGKKEEKLVLSDERRGCLKKQKKKQKKKNNHPYICVYLFDYSKIVFSSCTENKKTPFHCLWRF